MKFLDYALGGDMNEPLPMAESYESVAKTAADTPPRTSNRLTCISMVKCY